MFKKFVDTGLNFVKTIPDKAKVIWPCIKAFITVTFPAFLKSICSSIAGLFAGPAVAPAK